MRKNESLLNTWIHNHAYLQRDVAVKLFITYGTLLMWLSKGFVPRGSILKVAKRLDISEGKLIEEYNKANGTTDV